jgi:hypothetical protein
MTNLTYPIDIPERQGKTVKRGVAAGVPIFKGGLLELNVRGYVQPFCPTDNLPFAGIAAEGSIVPISPLQATLVGTTGGWATVAVEITGLHKFAYAAASVTNINSLVYTAGDDNTISLTENGQPIGIVQDYESGYLWVNITGFASSLPQRLDPVGVINVPFSQTTGTQFTGITLPPRAIVMDVIVEYTTPLTGASVSLGLATIANTNLNNNCLVNASLSPATGSPGFVDLIFESTTSTNITLGAFLNQATIKSGDATPIYAATQKYYASPQNPTLTQFTATAVAAATPITGVFHVQYMVV